MVFFLGQRENRLTVNNFLLPTGVFKSETGIRRYRGEIASAKCSGFRKGNVPSFFEFSGSNSKYFLAESKSLESRDAISRPDSIERVSLKICN